MCQAVLDIDEEGTEVPEELCLTLIITLIATLTVISENIGLLLIFTLSLLASTLRHPAHASSSFGYSAPNLLLLLYKNKGRADSHGLQCNRVATGLGGLHASEWGGTRSGVAWSPARTSQGTDFIFETA